ncbi:hypothetical protein VNO80_33109 [Phaseolus coccineus]|uniref:Uncharacterized protein n=1 Tax=Phaseolus coccineus TaxID=3886 RepID=A0AAN9L2B5_PHACN
MAGQNKKSFLASKGSGLAFLRLSPQILLMVGFNRSLFHLPRSKGYAAIYATPKYAPRINGLNYCFFNASPATCSPFVLAPARTGTVSKRSFCSWERGPKAHPYAFGFRVKNRVGETCQALG